MLRDECPRESFWLYWPSLCPSAPSSVQRMSRPLRTTAQSKTAGRRAKKAEPRGSDGVALSPFFATLALSSVSTRAPSRGLSRCFRASSRRLGASGSSPRPKKQTHRRCRLQRSAREGRAKGRPCSELASSTAASSRSSRRARQGRRRPPLPRRLECILVGAIGMTTTKTKRRHASKKRQRTSGARRNESAALAAAPPPTTTTRGIRPSPRPCGLLLLPGAAWRYLRERRRVSMSRKRSSALTGVQRLAFSL